MKKIWVRGICFFLAFLMLSTAAPFRTMAFDETEFYLPEVQLEQEILLGDMFYLGTVSASIEEGGRGVYLLRVGRGGAADSESTACIKFSDITAVYGRDYTVRVRGESGSIERNEDSFSVMELVEGQPFTQTELGSEDELAETLEKDPAAAEAYEEGIRAGVAYIDQASGLADKAAAAGGLPVSAGGEIDEVQQARAMFTGVDSVSQRLSTESDLIQDLQSVANVMTDAVVGTSTELVFRPGERVKYLEIVPIDNRIGDGNRMFYIVLGPPSGTTTNSAASTCAVTILDDEPREIAAVSFAFQEPISDWKP